MGAARGKHVRSLADFAIALIVAAAALVAHRAWIGGDQARFALRRGDLPGFDTHVYVAMAENPAVFTAAPWGFRLLVPAVVHGLPLRTGVGFRAVTLWSLVAAGGFLALFWMRLGHRRPPALLGVALFCWTPYVGSCLRVPLFVEPLAVALEAAFLLALEAGLGVGALMLLALLATAAKEVLIGLVPLVYLARRDRIGHRQALRETVIVLLPALAWQVVLRFWWAPYAGGFHPRFDAALLADVSSLLQRSWTHWLFLGGLLPLAVLGLGVPAARAVLRRYGWGLGFLFLVPLINPALHPFSLPFLRAELSRYAIFVLPLVIPIGLFTLARVCPPVRSDPDSGPAWLNRGAAALALLLVLVPFCCLDRYRRGEIRGRDGGRLLSTVRQGPRIAAAIARGEEILLDRETVPGSPEPASEEAPAPWFLREGWHRPAGRGDGWVWMTGPEATLIIPLFTPRDLALRIDGVSPDSVPARVNVNDRLVGTLQLGASGERSTVRIPAAALFRGDNLVRLVPATPLRAPLELRQIAITPGPG